MSLDALLERLVVATERVAAALETRLELVATPDQPAVEPEKPKRGRQRKEEKVDAGQAEAAAGQEAAAVAQAAASKAVTKSFLDDEDEPATAAVPELTEAEHRAEIRKQMLALQKALDPDRALSVLVKYGKAETLKALKPENFAPLYAAIAAAMPKAAA